MASFPPCPQSLKPIMHFLKIASEHDERNPVVAYWARLHALQVGIKLSSGRKSKDETVLLTALIEWLENAKKAGADNEAITSEICAKAVIEEYVLKIFKYADEQDRAANFNKNLVKAFYTCGIVMDILSVFGEISEDITEKQKYAKWKAAYIHNCLKNGETPMPGPLSDNTDEQGSDDLNEEEPTPTSSAANKHPSGPYTPPVAPSNFPPPYQNPDLPGPANLPNVPILPSVPSTFDPPEPSMGNPPNVLPGFQMPIPTNNTVVPPVQPVVMPFKATPGAATLYPNLTPDQIGKAQKYCKWAASALNYDDTKTAVSSLERALELLKTGVDPPESK